MYLRMTAIAMVSALAFVGAANAKGDWLDTAWNDDAPPHSEAGLQLTQNGAPAINTHTVGSEVVVVLTLPKNILDERHAAGDSSEQIASAFLGRFASRQCSGVVNMSVKHDRLHVQLSTLSAGSVLPDGEMKELATVIAAGKNIGNSETDANKLELKQKATAAEQYLKGLEEAKAGFYSDKKNVDLWIDFVPEKATTCVDPDEFYKSHPALKQVPGKQQEI